MLLSIISIVFSIYHLKIVNTQETATNANSILQNETEFQILMDMTTTVSIPLVDDASEINSLLKFVLVNITKLLDKEDNTATDSLEDYHELIKTDINDIMKDLKPYEEFVYNPFFNEHKQRTKTFLLCCFPKNISKNHQIEEFLINYKSADSHILTILKCLTKLNGTEKEYCQKDLKTLYAIRKDNKYYLSQKFKNNQSLAERWLKIFENIDIDIDTKNVVQNYEDTTKNQCSLTLGILWSPKDLIECEKKIRLSFPNNNEPAEIYYKYSYEISLPYLELTLDLLKDFKNKWQSLEGEEAPHTIPDMSPSISNKTIDYDMITFKDTLSSYATDRELLNHPMIKHYALRAHQYLLCCGKNESSEYFNEYLSNYAMNFTDYFLFYLFTQKCINRQLKSDPTFDLAECQQASVPLVTANDEFNIFIRTFRKQNPNIQENLRQTLDLETKQIQIIQRERVYVDSYCRNYHIFELMFNFDKWIECELMIRFSLKSDISDYYQYVNLISKLFDTLILDHWRKMKNIVDNLNTDTTTTSSENEDKSQEENHRPKIEPQPQSDYIYDNTASIQTIMYPLLCISILNFIQKIFS